MPLWTGPWLADSGVLLASQVLTTAATSAAAILIARQLSPRDWGIFSGFLGLSVALVFVIQFGMATWLLRELSRLFAADRPGAEVSGARLVSAAVAVTGALAGAALLAGLVVAKLEELDIGVTIALASLLIYSGLIAASSVMEAHLRARRRVRRVATATILEKSVLVALVIASATTSHGGVAAIGLAYFVAGTMRATFVRRSVFSRLRVARQFPNAAIIKRVLKGSMAFALTSASLAVIPKLDAFLLLVLSATSAGYFALGDRLMGAAVVFPEVLSVTLYPFFARKHHQLSPPWRLTFAFAALGGAVSIAAILSAPAFVPALFGAEYEAAVPTVQVCCLVLPAISALGPLRVYAYSRDQERRVVALALAASLVGSIGIVTGQLLVGVVMAAGAYVLRYVVFAGGLAYISAKVGVQTRRPDSEPAPAATQEIKVTPL
jgi:O-antigen/teichoic acid export membrane protein